MMCSTALRLQHHAGDHCGCRPARAPRCPAAEAKAWGCGGHRCSHPGTEPGDAWVGALEQHLGVLCNNPGGHREEIVHLCSFSLASGQSSEQSCRSTSTTAFGHGKLELSKTMFNSRPTGSDILASRKLGNYIPAI